MSIRFTVTKGPDKGKSFDLETGATSLMGRSSKADITIRDMGISRIHCQLKNDGTHCVVEDLNSKNGTLVNGRPVVEPTILHRNDMIKIGTSIIQVDTTPEQTDREIEDLELNLFDDEEKPSGVQTEADSDKDDALDLDTTPPAAEAAVQREGTPGAVPFPSGQQPQAPNGPAAEEEAAPHLEPGAVIAGCRVEDYKGRDCLSSIYRAKQLSMDRPVELRILSKELTKDDGAIKRFTAAARAAGRLTHPHILQVYDAGRTDDDIYFIALESAEGRTLRALFREAGRGNPLPLTRALTIAEQVAGALAHAHSQGICHGALSLDNIIYTNHGISKLAELGFAKGLKEAGIDADMDKKHVTQFSAPEQLQVPPQIEQRTDVYAMGACLFMMLSGHLPFSARTDEEMEDKILRGEHESLYALRPTLPHELFDIVEKTLMADPAERYANAGELHRAVARVRERYQ